ncbi:MAG: DUF4248 domain-containing protein [Bacteroidales bacterium]
MMNSLIRKKQKSMMLSYRKLAEMYFPDIHPRSATNQLSRWIRRCKPLFDELVALGYRPRLRYLSLTQVNKIYYYLGEP